ncbi:MAG: Ppx/GppA phosphatase family protein [Gammaproteobacteria bacterium]
MIDDTQEHSHHVAAIDMGTNSFHMIIAGISESGTFRIVDREKQWVRLGDGTDVRGRLNNDAIERMLESLRHFKRLSEVYDATMICIATSALRDAPNQRAILRKIQRETGLYVDIVSGQEEARLIFQGVRSEGHIGNDDVMIIDIGGGSTEIIVGNNDGIKAAESMNMGARRYTHQFFNRLNFKKREIKSCQKAAASKIQSISAVFEPWTNIKIIGTSGTIQTLAQLCNASEKRQNPNSLDLKDLQNNLPSLIEKIKLDEPLQNVEGERKNTLVAGAIILIEVMSALGLKTLSLSDSALREGIIYDRVESHGALPVLPMSAAVDAMIKRFNIDSDQVSRVLTTAKLIVMTFMNELGLNKEAIELLYAACKLHEIGLTVSHKKMHIHGAYMLMNADLTGITQRQQELISAIVRFHRKAKPNQRHIELREIRNHDTELVIKLSAILRLAAALNRTRDGNPAQPEIQLGKDQCNFIFNP